MPEFALPQFRVALNDRDLALRVLDSLEQQVAASANLSADVVAATSQPNEVNIHQKIRRQIICQQIAAIKELLVNSLPT